MKHPVDSTIRRMVRGSGSALCGHRQQGLIAEAAMMRKAGALAAQGHARNVLSHSLASEQHDCCKRAGSLA